MKYFFTTTMIYGLLATSLVACANEKPVTNDLTIIDKVNKLTEITPNRLKNIESIINFKFEKQQQGDAFNTATASVNFLKNTHLKSIEYRYRFEKNSPLSFLLLKVKDSKCISKEIIMTSFGTPIDKYIPKVHFRAGKKLVAPYKNIAEYYIYKVNNKKLSISFPLNPTTGTPNDSACVSGVIIDYDKYRTTN